MNGFEMTKEEVLGMLTKSEVTESIISLQDQFTELLTKHGEILSQLNAESDCQALLRDESKEMEAEIEELQRFWIPISEGVPVVAEGEFIEVLARVDPDLHFEGGNIWAADFYTKRKMYNGHVNNNIFCLANGCLCSSYSIKAYAYVPEWREDGH